MASADSFETGTNRLGTSPCEYLTTRSKWNCSSTLLKTGKTAENTNTRIAAIPARSQTNLRALAARCASDSSGDASTTGAFPRGCRLTDERLSFNDRQCSIFGNERFEPARLPDARSHR